MGAAPVIEVRDLAFDYPQTPVLRNVSFAIQPGDFVCMVGPNGGGKTTLLKLMLGLLTPARGTIRVFGRSPVEARRRIGYMPQRAHLDPQFPVRAIDVVLMGRLRGWRLGPYAAVDRARAVQALSEVGLAELARRPFSALSGGQRQRVLVARALACEPELLLLDEPTANLDPLMQDDVHDLLEQLNKRLTIVIVSHDVGFVAKHVKTVVCVNRDVQVHCATAISGENILDLYGRDVHMVHHGHAH
jgi:zinc transport system ATP-binding protein